ncbi:MAG: hypothetical protein ACOCZQ_00545 [Nanoarchaeota archaeon]
MSVHIASLGKETGHIMSAFKNYKIESLLLITSKKFENEALEIKKKVGYFDTETDIVYIDPFSQRAYMEILNQTFSFLKERDSKEGIFFNITGGTNLMSSAVLTAAQFLGGSAYYIIKGKGGDEFIEVPIVKISLKDALTQKQKRILNIIFREQKRSGAITNLNNFAQRSGLYKQKLRFYIQHFEKLNLIRINKNGREHTLELTETGHLIKQLL